MTDGSLRSLIAQWREEADLEAEMRRFAEEHRQIFDADTEEAQQALAWAETLKALR